jgi:uncharacterized membrane protein YdcZ (DUF606 family)
LVFAVLLPLIVHNPTPSLEQLRAAPWWTWLAGGLLGTAYLTATSCSHRSRAQAPWSDW